MSDQITIKRTCARCLKEKSIDLEEAKRDKEGIYFKKEFICKKCLKQEKYGRGNKNRRK